MLPISVIVVLLTSVIFMIACRPLAISIGLVDRPGGRKSHTGDIPIVGGAAMFLGLMLGASLLPDLAVDFSHLALCAGVLVAVGMLDDRFHLSATVRLASQVLVVLLMAYGAELMLWDLGDAFGFGTVSLGPLSLVITALVTMTIINAMNMSDGIDGLAGSMALVPLCAIAIVADVSSPAFQLAVIAIAAIVAFLLFNFPVAGNRSLRSFMGDGGSTMLGLVIVWVALSVSQGEGRIISPVIALWFASIPVYDFFTCIVRRLVRGKSPFASDNGHFHYRLTRSGMSVRQTLFLLTGLQTLYACFGLVAHFYGVPDVIMLSTWVALGISQNKIITWLASAFRASRQKQADLAADKVIERQF